MINCRSLITGLISFAVTAPAIVRADNLMPVKSYSVIGWDLGGKYATMITEYYRGRIIRSYLINSSYGKLGNIRIEN